MAELFPEVLDLICSIGLILTVMFGSFHIVRGGIGPVTFKKPLFQNEASLHPFVPEDAA
jgi:hypothetical protein